MKGKPPFILYSHINKPQSSRFLYKRIDPLRKIYDRIPGSILKETPEIEKLVHPIKKIYFREIKKNEKPKAIEIDFNMEDAQQKNISSINDFREMFYNYNLEEREQLSNFYDVQEENNQFSRDYQKSQKEKNKFSTGTYLDHEYLIGIASRYAERGIKVPKVSVDKNVFSANPLILGGSDLEKYFLYNLGERKKSAVFLKKVENMVRRVIAGNTKLSNEERKKLDFLEKVEKPKGYIAPNILIPKLKNEINQTKFTYDNLENFDKFFENYEKKDYSKDKIFTKLEKNRNNRSSNNIFSNLFKLKNNILNNKIKIHKNLSFIKKINFNNNNKFTSSSTRAYCPSKRFSSSNSRNILSYKDLSKSNPSSAVSREKSKFLKYSPIISPFSRGNNNGINLYNNLYNGITKKDNNANDFFILSKPFEYPEKNTYNILYDNINKKNMNKKIIKKNLISFRKNSAVSIISKDTKNIKSENNISKEDKEQESEDDEIRLLNKELEGKEENKNNNDLKLILDSNIDKSSIDKNNDIILNDNNSISDNILKPIKKINIPDNSEKKLEIEAQTNKNDDNYNKIEKIFNSILGNEYQTRRSKSVINDFLQSRGYNINKKYSSKDAYFNINRMKTKAIERNFLLEEFKIRNGEYSKTPLTNKQQAIIDKNDFFAQEIKRNETILKKLICEKNIEKEDMD